MAKKRLLFLTDSSSAKTGFGQMSLRLFTSLYKTGKYEILHLCQGIPEGEPNLLRTPWKSQGVIPQNQQFIQRMNQDQNWGRLASYGAEAIEPAVLSYRPDVVVVINDPWGSSDISVSKEFWNKTNCVAWVTYDSTPLYQPSLDHIDKLKNLYCWSTFAEKEFHKLGHRHVRTQFPPVDVENFKPLTKGDKLRYKQYFRISDKKFILNYTFRSQLRKQSWTLIEAYSLLQKEYPEIAKDVWLHFHCHLGEGWNHKKFCEQYGVDYNRILFTWICKACKELQIKCDNGDKNCPHCQTQSSQDTCNVGFGATPEQMNWMYNAADCSAIVANSGATEIPAIEGLAAGLPLATIDYSYGCDFCAQDFVYTIDSTKSVEFGTQFIKMMPIARSIMKYIKKMYQMSSDERERIVKAGREWTVKNFSTEVVSQKWQDVFDNMPEVTWDFTYKPDLKNVNAPIPTEVMGIESDAEFIKACYKILLNMDVTDQDSGKLHWENFLRQPQDKRVLRENLINSFRLAGQEHNNRNNVVPFESFLNKDDNKRVLIAMPESIGDLIIVSATLESIRKRYPKPEYTIYFATNPNYFEIFDLNPYIDKLIPFLPQMDNHLGLTGQGGNKGLFDIVYNPYFLTQRIIGYVNGGIDKIDLQLKEVA